MSILKALAKVIIFYCPELVILILAISLSYFIPEIYSKFGDFIKSDPGILVLFIGAPAGLLIYSWILSNKMLKPLEGSNKIFYEWKDYKKFKYGCYSSIIIGGICVLLEIIAFSIANSNLMLGKYYVTCISLSITEVCTQGLAIVSMREIFDKYLD